MSTFDYVVVGGGLSGCVVASRLRQAFPSLRVALIETGGDQRANPAVLSPAAAWFLDDALYHRYGTTPQAHLQGRSVPLKTGAVLGGGTAVNYGAWTRGDRAGYDAWAKVVGDAAWSYDGLVPFFRRSETWPGGGEDEQHGTEGPIRVTVSSRGYPLREKVRRAMLATGAEANADGNDGDILGVVPLVESWFRNERSFAANAYDLTGVKILTECQATKILLDGTRAAGVLLRDGRTLTARREVVVSCGAIRTPQLLMLSGIGPSDELHRLGIPCVVDAASVGQNLHDHPIIPFWYTLRNPQDNLAVGSAGFASHANYLEGNVMDWILNASAPSSAKAAAAEIDGGSASSRRDDIEILCAYVPIPTGPFPVPPVDGKTITAVVVLLSTTSRGQISLRSADINDLPLVDPAYMATEHDRVVMREGARVALQMMESDAAREMVLAEQAPGTLPALKSTSTDAELDERVQATVGSCFHYAGTAAMGAVVDTACRVRGVTGLRVVDASILPVSIGAHLQAVMYGVAERAAQMIIDDGR